MAIPAKRRMAFRHHNPISSYRNNRPAFPSTSKVLSLCNNAAIIAPAAPSKPNAAATTIASVQPSLITTFHCKVRRHSLLKRTQVPKRRRSPLISTISAAASAMSAPPAPALNARFSGAIHGVFLVACGVAGVAFVLAWLLQEVPLRKAVSA